VKFDVLIVGGGMVGATLAATLGRDGLRVAVVEAKETPQLPEHDLDVRVSAITRASQHVFESIGVWDALPSDRVQAFREMVVWDDPGAGEVHFDSAEIAEPALGHIVENVLIQHALNMRLEALDTVEVFRPARLDSLTVEASRAVAEVDGVRISAALVVGADGTRSRIRDLAGIEASVAVYGQQAVVGTVTTAKHHQETAWQRFLPSGPLAFLPLPKGKVSVVWSTSPTHARALQRMTPEGFAGALEAAFDGRLGEITSVGERATFELTSLHAREYVRERVALVGDAAHTVHPLAGQGVNLGILDAAALTEVLAAARDGDRDIGRLLTLRKYERWRRGHNAFMRQTLSGFNWLFGNSFAPLRGARNLGLGLTDRITPLKRLFMAHASGLSGDLPALTRGR
jgi:2-octaprenylphenol hydroxylase